METTYAINVNALRLVSLNTALTAQAAVVILST